MFDPTQPSIAAAYVLDSQGRLLLIWNNKWNFFPLSMTKLPSGQPAETPEQAGVRTVAEVLVAPIGVAPDNASKLARGLQKSSHDGDIKNYQFDVVSMEDHPDFASQLSRQPLVWIAIDKLQTGEYQPVSKSVQSLLPQCIT